MATLDRSHACCRHATQCLSSLPQVCACLLRLPYPLPHLSHRLLLCGAEGCRLQHPPCVTRATPCVHSETIKRKVFYYSVAQVILKILIMPWWTTYQRQSKTQEPPVPVRVNFSLLITPVCDSWFLSFEYVAASCYLGQSCPDFLPASYSAS